MDWYYVIADDLTGANAAGILLKRAGMQPKIVVESDVKAVWKTEGYDTVICSTGSRNARSPEAYRLVRERMEQIGKEPPKLITKRIDSTMRGNVGAEIDAVLDCLGLEYVMLVSPAFPSAGRTVRGGKLYVNGVPLDKTEAALDPRKPVKSSDIKGILEEQSRCRQAGIHLSVLHSGEAELVEAIMKKIGGGARLLVCDAETDTDLQLIAKAFIKCGVKFAIADPGPLTACVAEEQRKYEKKKEKILLLIGSVNPVTAEQLVYFWEKNGTQSTVFVSGQQILESRQTYQKEVQRATKRCLEIYRQGNTAVVVGDGIFPDKRIDFTAFDREGEKGADYYSELLNTSFSQIARKLVRQEANIRKFYLSGGDVALSVFKALGIKEFYPVEEVVPLGVYGIAKGRKLGHSGVITKGGMAGGRNAIVKCVSFLQG